MISYDESYDLRTSTESRWLVQIGEGTNPSTFGAIGDEPKASTLYNTFEWPINIIGNLGGNADPSVPYLWDGRFFCDSAKPAKQSYKYVLK